MRFVVEDVLRSIVRKYRTRLDQKQSQVDSVSAGQQQDDDTKD
jgi:hypothetical protein